MSPFVLGLATRMWILMFMWSFWALSKCRHTDGRIQAQDRGIAARILMFMWSLGPLPENSQIRGPAVVWRPYERTTRRQTP